jgi:hypothetical protein
MLRGFGFTSGSLTVTTRRGLHRLNLGSYRGEVRIQKDLETQIRASQLRLPKNEGPLPRRGRKLSDSHIQSDPRPR